MSARRASPTSLAASSSRHARVFAALGDETRLSLVARLCRESPLSITQLAEGARITRQGLTKHLRVLEGAGIVRGSKEGRETLFKLEPVPLSAAQDYLARVSAQWDDLLGRLQAFVED